MLVRIRLPGVEPSLSAATTASDRDVVVEREVLEPLDDDGDALVLVGGRAGR